MRVTSGMMRAATLRDLGQGLERLETAQQRITSGRRVERPSDAPGDTVDALALRRELRRLDRHQRSLDDARLRSSAADDHLSQALDRLARVADLAVQGASAVAAGTPSARAALAEEVRLARADVLALANSTVGGRPVFAGTGTAPAYAPDGSYLGTTEPVEREVAPGFTVTVNEAGPHVFGGSPGSGRSLFAVLDGLATALERGDAAAIAAEQSALSSSTERIRAAAGRTGSTVAALERLAARADEQRVVTRNRLAEVEDVDLVDALITAKAAESSYQAAVQVAATVLPVSLVDFLR